MSGHPTSRPPQMQEQRPRFHTIVGLDAENLRLVPEVYHHSKIIKFKKHSRGVYMRGLYALVHTPGYEDLIPAGTSPADFDPDEILLRELWKSDWEESVN